MVNRGPDATDTQVPEITDQDVLDRVNEVVAYGYGRIEIVVRDHKISTVNETKSLVRANNNRG